MRHCEFWVVVQNSLKLLKEISQAWLGLIWTWRPALRNYMFESCCQKLSKPAAVMVLDMVIRVICSLLLNFSLDHFFFFVSDRGLNSSDVLQCWTGMKLAQVVELHSIGYPANARELYCCILHMGLHLYFILICFLIVWLDAIWEFL